MPILVAITQNAYTPAQLTNMLRETYDIAKSKGNTKGMFEVIALVLAYAVGKPVSRSLVAGIDPEEIRSLLRGMGAGGDDEDDEG